MIAPFIHRRTTERTSGAELPPAHQLVTLAGNIRKKLAKFEKNEAKFFAKLLEVFQPCCRPSAAHCPLRCVQTRAAFPLSAAHGAALSQLERRRKRTQGWRRSWTCWAVGGLCSTLRAQSRRTSSKPLCKACPGLTSGTQAQSADSSTSRSRCRPSVLCDTVRCPCGRRHCQKDSMRAWKLTPLPVSACTGRVV